MNIIIEFFIFELVYVPNFSVSWQFFRPNIPKMYISSLKLIKREHRHWILHIWINLGIKFHLEQKFFNFGTKFAQIEKVKNRKNEYHHWILHIWLGLGTKFQLKLTNLIFWTKLAQKEYFQSKIEKVNTTIEFCMFELVYRHSQIIWDKL